MILREERNCSLSPSCLDDVLCTLAHAMNRDYKMFYAERWTFEEANAHKKPRKANNVSEKEYYEKILLLQGFSIQALDIKQFWRDRHKLIDQYKYLIALIDGYELPWDAYYQNNHNAHAIIIKEISINKNILICCDPWHELESVNLEIKHFKKGIHKLYIPVVAEIENPKERKLIQFSQYINGLNTNIFEKMCEMADDLSVESDFDKLFKRINKVVWDRWTFGIYLKSMKDINVEIYQYGVEMQNMSNIWNNIKLSLIKCGILCDSKNVRLSSLLDYVKHAIYDIAEREKLLYIQIINKEKISNKKIRKPINKKVNRELQNISIQHLYNNSGISKEGTIGKYKDFTGTGEYFVIDKNYEDVLNVSEKVNDNIICNGQEININRSYVNNLIILGCCEWGNYSDYLTIYDKENNPKEIPISLPDWSEGPQSGEEIYISGYVYKKEDNQVNKQNKAYIYMVEISISSYIKKIILPKCSNMHILAIQHD